MGQKVQLMLVRPEITRHLERATLVLGICSVALAFCVSHARRHLRPALAQEFMVAIRPMIVILIIFSAVLLVLWIVS